MNISNAPPRWKEIKKAAVTLGAEKWAMWKWIQRGKIPAEWQLKIISHTAGLIGIKDMEWPSTDKQERGRLRAAE